LIGATGGVGLWITHFLLKTNHNITLILRDKEKFLSLFKDHPNEFKKIILLDLE